MIALVKLQWETAAVFGRAFAMRWLTRRPWISNSFPHSLWFQISFLYIPIVLILLFNTVLYSLVGCKAREEDQHCYILLRSFAYTLWNLLFISYIIVAAFSILWSGFDRVFFALEERHLDFGVDLISFSVPLIVAMAVRWDVGISERVRVFDEQVLLLFVSEGAIDSGVRDRKRFDGRADSDDRSWWDVI